MLSGTVNGLLAGILVSIGGTVLLSCENGVIGACFFTIALLVICLRDYSLYTGKIGFLVASHKKKDVTILLSGLFGNLLGTALCGFAVSYALPDRMEKAVALWAGKMELPLLAVLIRAIFCGILMYIAVVIWKENKTIVGVLFCIPVFILSGFEHSIADLFYFFAARTFTGRSLLFLLLVIAGNSIGSLLFALLRRLRDGNQKKKHTLIELIPEDKERV